MPSPPLSKPKFTLPNVTNYFPDDPGVISEDIHISYNPTILKGPVKV